MRAYGIENYKGVIGNRKTKRRGFKYRTCPCCMRVNFFNKYSKFFKKRARQNNKKVTKEDLL